MRPSVHVVAGRASLHPCTPAPLHPRPSVNIPPPAHFLARPPPSLSFSRHPCYLSISVWQLCSTFGCPPILCPSAWPLAATRILLFTQGVAL